MASSAGSSSRSSRSRRSAVNTPASETSESQTSNESNGDIIEIASNGDLVLRVEHDNGSTKAIHSFRTSSHMLRTNSKYFDRVLRSGRFSESTEIATQHEKLVALYGSAAKAPPTELPVLEIKDLGRISNVKAVDALLKDFLYVLHDKDIQIAQPVVNFANLAIAADRFDALDILRNYVSRKKILEAIEGRTTPKVEAQLTEEKSRQRLLVAIFFNYPHWLRHYSTRLIMKGWVGKEHGLSAPLWWDLPMRVEEELAYRHECVLETIRSVDSHFLDLYTSRERQCRLGYDNSAQCDSFQLGEFIRFSTRAGTLKLHRGTLEIQGQSSEVGGDLIVVLDIHRAVPEYQIDKFHSHCGVRTRLKPMLDMIHHCLQFLGLCPQCWQKDFWILEKRPLFWKRQDVDDMLRGHSHRHASMHAMFTATERDWT